MTLLIDGYTITGTPEEINTFIKIYKQKDTNTNIGCHLILEILMHNLHYDTLLN